MIRVGVFVFGANEPSPYGRLLSMWAKDSEGVSLFTDSTSVADGFHYLRFARMHSERPFDVLIYDIDDSAAHAAAFPFIAKWPGILFCNDISLWHFTRAISHEPGDGWGTGWIFNVVAPERAESLIKLAESDVDPGSVLESSPLAVALALRSAGIVVPDLTWETRLTRGRRLPPIGVINQSTSNEKFAAIMERFLPAWQEWTGHMNSVLEPIEHPFQDLHEVEQKRVHQRNGDGPEDKLNLALETLREMFDGATNSATAVEGENE